MNGIPAPAALPTTLADWLALLESRHPRGADGITLGLARVRAVSQALGQHPFAPIITVGGTNGKGSTCAMLENILRHAGYRVGLYTSPHLLDYNERVRINGQAIDDAALCAAFSQIEAARLAAGDVFLSYFEVGTLAAWECFAAIRPDVIILEVGLGGRLDATNIYDADCAIVTSIALDHQDFLGHDREQIGFEKAGIFRSGRVAICADPQPPQTLLAHAADIAADLRLINRDFGHVEQDLLQWQYWSRSPSPAATAIQRRSGLAHPGLRGPIQLQNASGVLAALDALREQLPVAMRDIRQGLLEVELPGRFQMLPGRPQIVLDIAHNPQAIQLLADNLSGRGQGYYQQTWAVFGMMRDKDVAAALKLLQTRIDHWLLCDLPGSRAATADELATTLHTIAPTASHWCFASVADALQLAREQAGENDRIVVFGSFLTVAAALRFIHAD
ncbi:MAG: bifunctional tetrahydrofolate synthase/dihydrofolate synthase [Sterolibacterium sp.]|nr:bifunctional tetrahydrofolate synthase/dihydrofolate synthase [Sterolibacterium sp.]